MTRPNQRGRFGGRLPRTDPIVTSTSDTAPTSGRKAETRRLLDETKALRVILGVQKRRMDALEARLAMLESSTEPNT